MGKHFHIRNAKKEDIPHILSLLKETGLYFEPVDDYELYEHQLRSSPGSVILAETDGEIVGVVVVLFNPLGSLIGHLASSPLYRRRRLATILLREALEYVRKRGGKCVVGYAEQKNTASIKLLRSLGAKVYEQPLICAYKKL